MKSTDTNINSNSNNFWAIQRWALNLLIILPEIDPSNKILSEVSLDIVDFKYVSAGQIQIQIPSLPLTHIMYIDY